MMDYVKLCLELGAYKAAQIKTEQLVFSESFRGLCEQNACGRYGRSYTCPPHVGEISALIRDIQKRKTAVIWQTIHPLEDSYDFEGMGRGRELHADITLRIAEQVPGTMVPRALVLGAGGCFICKTCGVNENVPCRFPGKALSSLEAYGIDVSSIEKVTDMKYINGVNTVTYFSGLFL